MLNSLMGKRKKGERICILHIATLYIKFKDGLQYIWMISETLLYEAYWFVRRRSQEPQPANVVVGDLDCAQPR